MPNVHVLPPGNGRAVGVDVVGFMPVGRDVLLGYSFGLWLNHLRNNEVTAKQKWLLRAWRGPGWLARERTGLVPLKVIMHAFLNLRLSTNLDNDHLIIGRATIDATQTQWIYNHSSLMQSALNSHATAKGLTKVTDHLCRSQIVYMSLCDCRAAKPQTESRTEHNDCFHDFTAQQYCSRTRSVCTNSRTRSCSSTNRTRKCGLRPPPP